MKRIPASSSAFLAIASAPGSSVRKATTNVAFGSGACASVSVPGSSSLVSRSSGDSSMTKVTWQTAHSATNQSYRRPQFGQIFGESGTDQHRQQRLLRVQAIFRLVKDH